MFISGLNYWNNGVGGGYPYLLVTEKIKATSFANSYNEKTYKINQSFDLNDLAIAGGISVWGKWQTSNGVDYTGTVQFLIQLEKPDTTLVTLYSHVYSYPDSGEGYLLSSGLDDILPYLSQQGTYKLWLTCIVSSAATYDDETHKWTYYPSYGWHDNISIPINIRKFKTVIESIGASESETLKPSITKSEIIELFEDFSAKVLTIYKGSGVDIAGLFESYLLKVLISKAEAIELAESYSYFAGWRKEAKESLGLREMAQAKTIIGNVETTYYIGKTEEWEEPIAHETSWQQIPPVETEWEEKDNLELMSIWLPGEKKSSGWKSKKRIKSK
jgi:hypothetical protein